MPLTTTNNLKLGENTNAKSIQYGTDQTVGSDMSLHKSLHVGVLGLLLDGENLFDLCVCSNENGGDESEGTHQTPQNQLRESHFAIVQLHWGSSDVPGTDSNS